MVNCLQNEGVTIAFGYPGATIAPFYNSLLDSSIRHILTRGEQSAGHAASGYARITGKPGVCVATSGPGATNLFTAIATAYSDSIPMIAITGQVATYQLGRDVFQEVDTTGATASFTKYSYLVKEVADLPRVFKEAFHIAAGGRKGPVLIDVPVDVQKELIEFEYPASVHIRGYKPNYDGHPLQLRKVAQAMKNARRPLICCGGGLLQQGAEDALRQFCEQTGIPAVSTMMGIGALQPGHELCFGMLGQSGLKTANQAIKESDLLMLVGARVGDRAITQPASLESTTTIVHIDIDSAEIGKNLGTTIPVVGDASRILKQLMHKDIKGDWQEWVERLNEMRRAERHKMAEISPRQGMVDPNAFVRLLCRKLPQDAIYVADVGQNQIWSARNFIANGRFLTTGGMGTMGYSIPAAIGAKLAAPQRTVLAVCGDGSFQMSMNEIATMCQHDVPVKIVVMRNNKLGLVSEIQQHSFSGREIAVDLAGSPNFGLLAHAFGIEHALVTSLEESAAAIERMLAGPAPFVLECVVE